MSRTKVFCPQTEIADLNKRIAQLESEVNELRRSTVTKAVGTFAGWPPDSFPKSVDGFPTNYKLCNDKEVK